MNKISKKLISAVLCAIMVFSLCIPSFAALEMNNYPTIHINGRSSLVYDKNGNQIYTNPDPSFSEVEYAKSLVPIMVQELSKAFVTQNWENYSRIICDKITPLFEMIQLDENGDVKDGTNGGEWKVGTPLSPSKNYTFQWDWRVDPFETAALLKEYIKEVKRVNNCEKVNIDSRCLGSVIATAYLYLVGDEAKDNVANLVLYVPTVAGSQTVGALFANQIYFDDKAIDEYVTYYMNGNDRFLNDTAYGDELEIFVATFCSFLYQLKALGYGTEVFNYIYKQVKNYMVPRLATNVFFFPTYWAMIDDRYYEAAKEQLFKDDSDGYYTADKTAYAEYIKKIDNYHYNVQVNSEKILTDAKNSGINISVIAKYGDNLLPVEKNSRALGDGRIETKALSFGATCSTMTGTLSKDYIASHDAKYISADKKIDASTCLFPDNTWFVRDCKHPDFPNCIEQFKEILLRSKEQPTIENIKENYSYTQFMTYGAKDDSLTEITGAAPLDKLYTNDFFVSLFRFLTALVNLLTKIMAVKK
ncbi:MAG: hypothetical protein Q4D20_05045 [Clostridia bacterium]|nr:hypothetical protein [Clostridia bacterium]